MKKLGLDNEKELVILLKEGHHYAFKILFQYYGKKLFHLSLKYFNDAADAEEVVQEVFLKIWEQKENLKEDLSFNSYLITIAKNHIFNKLRKKVNSDAYQHYLLASRDARQSTTEDDANFNMLNEVINNGIKAMPPQRQQVYIMSRHEGKDNREIAMMLNISRSTVENHLNKALKTIKKYIDLGFGQ